MFREKFIARVPETIIQGAHFSHKPWERTFNIACWVRFHMPRQSQIGLVLHYTDEQGQKSADIDQCSTHLESTALLSAHVTIAGKGHVKEMSLFLRVEENSPPYVIDELYVQNCGKDAQQQPKIISAA